FFSVSSPTCIYTLSLHDALPISCETVSRKESGIHGKPNETRRSVGPFPLPPELPARHSDFGFWISFVICHLSFLCLSSFVIRILDRKSTRLNSSHRTISYAVFCL